jgi:hypothetical protein
MHSPPEGSHSLRPPRPTSPCARPQIESLDNQADDAATGAWIGYVAAGAVLATWIGAGAGGVAGEF